MRNLQRAAFRLAKGTGIPDTRHADAIALGRKGGSVTSIRKSETSAKNGKKGGRPRHLRRTIAPQVWRDSAPGHQFTLIGQ